MCFLHTDTGDKNEMQKLEEKARQLAEEAMKDQPPKPDKGILFVRCVECMLIFN